MSSLCILALALTGNLNLTFKVGQDQISIWPRSNLNMAIDSSYTTFYIRFHGNSNVCFICHRFRKIDDLQIVNTHTHTHKSINDVCVTWREGLRRVWGIPMGSHIDLLEPMCKSIPIFDELCHRN